MPFTAHLLLAVAIISALCKACYSIGPEGLLLSVTEITSPKMVLTGHLFRTCVPDEAFTQLQD